MSTTAEFKRVPGARPPLSDFEREARDVYARYRLAEHTTRLAAEMADCWISAHDPAAPNAYRAEIAKGFERALEETTLEAIVEVAQNLTATDFREGHHE